jgi:hypothetical protein
MTKNMRDLIVKEPLLLKWNTTHDVSSVTALEILRSAYPQTPVPIAKLLHISRPKLMSHRTKCT